MDRATVRKSRSNAAGFLPQAVLEPGQPGLASLSDGPRDHRPDPRRVRRRGRQRGGDGRARWSGSARVFGDFGREVTGLRGPTGGRAWRWMAPSAARSAGGFRASSRGSRTIYSGFQARLRWSNWMWLGSTRPWKIARRLIRRGVPGRPQLGLELPGGDDGQPIDSGPEARIVTVFPDRMERYFSTELFRP